MKSQCDTCRYTELHESVRLAKKEKSTNVLQIRLEQFESILKSISASQLKSSQQLSNKQKNEFKSKIYTDTKSSVECLRQTEGERTLIPSIGVDDEALCFSTNFVLMAFLFLMVVLLRDI